MHSLYAYFFSPSHRRFCSATPVPSPRCGYLPTHALAIRVGSVFFLIFDSVFSFSISLVRGLPSGVGGAGTGRSVGWDISSAHCTVVCFLYWIVECGVWMWVRLKLGNVLCTVRGTWSTSKSTLACHMGLICRCSYIRYIAGASESGRVGWPGLAMVRAGRCNVEVADTWCYCTRMSAWKRGLMLQVLSQYKTGVVKRVDAARKRTSYDGEKARRWR